MCRNGQRKLAPHLRLTRPSNGDRSLLRLNIDRIDLREIKNDKSIAGAEDQFIAVAHRTSDDARYNIPCSASHSACYVSPYGGLYPCVQFPLPSGNLRQQKFIDIWRYSP